MSTPGKVLVVLVLLVTPIWVVLFSAVAELNKNGTKAVETLKAQISKLEADVAKNERDIIVLKDETTLEQKATADQLAMLRSRQSDAEKARTELIEMASRVKLQLAGIEAAVKNAEAARDLRNAEKKQETEAIAAAEADVEKLKEEHANLTSQLDKLRSEFKDTLEENRKMADQVAKAVKRGS